MFLEFTDFYPLNIRSGFEFLFLYAVFGVLGIVILRLVRRTYGAHLDSAHAGNKLLSIGTIPGPELYYAIAYLKNGWAGGVDTLIAVAHASGCLRPNPESAKTYLVSLEPSAPDHPILRAFIERMIPEGSTPPAIVSATDVRNAAGNTMGEYRESLRKDLTASGLLRTPDTRSRVIRAVWIGGMIILSLGMLRLARAVILDHKYLFLVIEIAVLALSIFIVSRNTSDSDLKTDYLNWLRECTTSLRIGVSSGWTTTQQAVGLGVALDGASILGTAAIAGGLIYAFMPHYGTGTLPRHQPTPVAPSSTSDSCGGGSDGDNDATTWSTGSGCSAGSSSGGSSSCSGGSSSCSSGSGGSSCSGGSSGGSSCGGGGGGCGGGGGGCGGGGGGCGGGGG